MANFLTNSVMANIIPEKYVHPPHKRTALTRKADIPIIDLLDEKNATFRIMKASQEMRVFQVINHGVQTELMNKVLEVHHEIFNMSPEEKEKLTMETDTEKVCRYYKSSLTYETEEFHNWREVLRNVCFPMEECIKFWPQKPQTFKATAQQYVIAVKELSVRILEHISEGLGLERGFFSDELTAEASLTVNRYPPSPDPSLTIGLPKHTDATQITILQTNHVPGLQFLKDGQWFDVETLPNAFLVFIGSQLEVISNGKLKGVPHRVVSTTEGRMSVVFSIYPSLDCFVAPAKPILEATNTPARYKTFKYKDFFQVFAGPKAKGQEIDDAVHNLMVEA